MRLNTHQVNGPSDWALVPATRRNAWQKAAAATRGIVTIGNFFSLLSFAGASVGLVYILHGGHYVFGSVVILAGRICDLLDGYLADKTGTKSRLGEGIDAASDKVVTAGILVALAAYNVVPVWFVLLLGAPQAIITLMALAAFMKQRELHPHYAGKLSMGAGWVGLLAYVVAHAMTGPWHGAIRMAGIALLVVSVGLGVVAVVGHGRSLRRPS